MARYAQLLLAAACSVFMNTVWAQGEAPIKLADGVIAKAVAETGIQPEVPILPVSLVQRGMKGYGLSVFQGSEVERFDIEIVDVIPNFMPQQPIILARCSHPLLEKAKIVSGMSGSPMYVVLDGKPYMIGALAYGWSFQVESICGVTPIESMLQELQRDEKRREIYLARAQESGTDVAARSEDAGRPDMKIASPLPWGLYRAELERDGIRSEREILKAVFRRSSSRPVHGTWRGQELRPLATPLSIGGMSSRATGRLRDLLPEIGLLPVGLGGTSVSADQARANMATSFEPGGPIGVQLMRGDADWSGVGTVTYVDSRGVLGFGHPMFGYAGAGDIEAPVTTAHVHTIISNQMSSFKLATGGPQLGALSRDSRACIVARHGEAPRMVPISVRVTGAVDGRKRDFRFEAMRHKMYTPSLAMFAVWDSVDAAEPVMDNTTLHVKQRLKFEGLAPVEISNVFAAQGPFAFGIMSPLDYIASWPYQDIYLESADYEVEVHRDRRSARIESLRCPVTTVKAGEQVTVEVVLRTLDDGRQSVKLPVEIPDDLQGSLMIQVTGGNNTAPSMPSVDSVEQLAQNLQKLYQANDLVATVHLPSRRVHHREEVLVRLPASALMVMNAANDTQQVAVGSEKQQTVVRTDWVIYGAGNIQIQVEK